MKKLNRQQLIDMATQSYFANVDKKDMDAVLANFHDDAVFTIPTDPIVHEGKAGIRAMFENLFSGFEEVWHGDFECTADEESQSVSARFNVYLKTADGTEVRLSNCNFWYVEDGKFSRVFVFMSGDNVLR
ncbi:MAG: nuclear transport factor 2 family protein [Alcanivorax sp.]